MLIVFEKRDLLRHMGHLDLQRAMQRALRRSGLPIRYSQGFHPHVLVSFASALSMGVPSLAEVMDVPLEGDVTPEDCLARLNRALPEALRAHRAAAVADDYPKLMGILKQAAYRVVLDSPDAEAWQGATQEMLSREEYMAIRKSKRAEKLVDIRPMIHELTCAPGEAGETVLTLRLSAEEVATLKPQVLIAELAKLIDRPEPPFALLRTGLYQVVEGRPVSLLPQEEPCAGA